MDFGLTATDDDKSIDVGRQNFNYETMFDIRTEKFKWQNLPNIPSRVFVCIQRMNIYVILQDNTIDLGVSVINNTLYVIGGFDFIGRDKNNGKH